jgi:hypothetical protein
VSASTHRPSLLADTMRVPSWTNTDRAHPAGVTVETVGTATPVSASHHTIASSLPETCRCRHGVPTEARSRCDRRAVGWPPGQASHPHVASSLPRRAGAVMVVPRPAHPVGVTVEAVELYAGVASHTPVACRAVTMRVPSRLCPTERTQSV